MLAKILLCFTLMVVYVNSQCVGPCPCQSGYTCTNGECCASTSQCVGPCPCQSGYVCTNNGECCPSSTSTPCVAIGPAINGKCPSNSDSFNVNGQCCALCQALGPCLMNSQCQSGAVCYKRQCRQYCTGTASTCVGPCVNNTTCQSQYACTNQQCCQ